MRGTFILALLAIYIGGALVLFGLRVGHVKEGATFEPVSREAALVINNLSRSRSILGIVCIGTLYPLVTEAFGCEVSVGPPYFNPVIAADRVRHAAGAWRSGRCCAGAATSWRAVRGPVPGDCCGRRGRCCWPCG